MASQPQAGHSQKVAEAGTACKWRAGFKNVGLGGVGPVSAGQRIGLIWTAVSEDKGQTTEGQEAELRGVAARMGLLVPEGNVYNVTASRFMKNPPEKDEVLERARRREFDVLLVWKLDRWARDRKRGVREVFEVLPAYGVRVVSLQESFLSTEGLPDFYREWIGQLVLYMAEQESRDKSERTKLRYSTNRNRAAGGGGKAKWGRGRISTPDEEAEVVRLKVEEKLSVRAIAGRTGVPKSTVADLLKRVSETSRREGAIFQSQARERPGGALRTGQNADLGEVAIGAGSSAPDRKGPVVPTVKSPGRG